MCLATNLGHAPKAVSAARGLWQPTRSPWQQKAREKRDTLHHKHSNTSTCAHTHRRHINNPPWERFGLKHFLLFLSFILFFFFFHCFSPWSVKCPQIKINPLPLIKWMQPLDKRGCLTAGTMGGIRESLSAIAWVLPTTAPVSGSTQ